MLNNQPLLDFAAAGDPRISIEGDVTLDPEPPVPTYRSVSNVFFKNAM